MRNIYRHENDKGSVIEFDMYGKAMKMFVLDAKYRPENVTFGIPDTSVPELEYFTQDNIYMPNNDGYAVHSLTELPKVLSDSELQASLTSFATDKTARENTDILMKYNTPAVHACRNVDVGLGTMDLPNVYELMVIFQEADRLDALDPTFESNKDKGLGYKSRNGRFNRPNYDFMWSSTLYSDSDVRCVDCYGGVNYYSRVLSFAVVPVLEL